MLHCMIVFLLGLAFTLVPAELVAQTAEKPESTNNSILPRTDDWVAKYRMVADAREVFVSRDFDGALERLKEAYKVHNEFFQ